MANACQEKRKLPQATPATAQHAGQAKKYYAEMHHLPVQRYRQKQRVMESS